MCIYIRVCAGMLLSLCMETLGAVVATHSRLFLRLSIASVYPEHLRRTASTAGLRSVPHT